jgi:creatinine amidohydrolase
MRIRDLNWFQLEAYLERDDRAAVPLGSTEQHAYLSLLTDAILAERVVVEAAEPLGVPVFPALPFDASPYWLGFPGTIALRVETYVRVIEDILASLTVEGFRRPVLVSGHGGNAPASAVAREWSAGHTGAQVKYHSWWDAPRTWERVREVVPLGSGSHASWMENYPWSRLDGVEMPEGDKAVIDHTRLRVMDAQQIREYLGDGSFGGPYQRPDEDMLSIWEVGVAETREMLEKGWL